MCGTISVLLCIHDTEPKTNDKDKDTHDMVNGNSSKIGRIRSSVEAELERNERVRDRLLRRLDILESYGEDVWPNGTVIRFDKERAGTTYSYAAIKAADKWWTTSIRGPHLYETWEDLLSFMAGDTSSSHVTEFWVAAIWATPENYDRVLENFDETDTAADTEDAE